MFAQVTNPPIDSIRESVITDTTVYLGVSGNILEEDERNCRVLKVNNPILTNLDLMKIRGMDIDGLKTADISMLYTKDVSLHDAIENLYQQAEEAHAKGATILILTDRGVDHDHLAIRLCWQWLPWRPIWYAPERTLQFRLSSRPQSRARCIISQRCWALAQAQSIRIWHWIPCMI